MVVVISVLSWMVCTGGLSGDVIMNSFGSLDAMIICGVLLSSTS